MVISHKALHFSLTVLGRSTISKTDTFQTHPNKTPSTWTIWNKNHHVRKFLQARKKSPKIQSPSNKNIANEIVSSGYSPFSDQK
jgi:hypothetical protein